MFGRFKIKQLILYLLVASVAAVLEDRALDQSDRADHADSSRCEQERLARELLPAVADTVRRFHVPHEHLWAVLDGVEMDLDARRYELCAVFRTSRRDREPESPVRSARFWDHEAGRQCFTVEVEDRASEEPTVTLAD